MKASGARTCPAFIRRALITDAAELLSLPACKCQNAAHFFWGKQCIRVTWVLTFTHLILTLKQAPRMYQNAPLSDKKSKICMGMGRAPSPCHFPHWEGDIPSPEPTPLILAFSAVGVFVPFHLQLEQYLHSLRRYEGEKMDLETYRQTQPNCLMPPVPNTLVGGITASRLQSITCSMITAAVSSLRSGFVYRWVLSCRRWSATSSRDLYVCSTSYWIACNTNSLISTSDTDRLQCSDRYSALNSSEISHSKIWNNKASKLETKKADDHKKEEKKWHTN